MKSWHQEDEGSSSDDKKKQTQIHMVAIIISSIAILVLGLIAAPSMTHAQNTTSTPSNATTAESHNTNTTGTPLNTTSSAAPKPADS